MKNVVKLSEKVAVTQRRSMQNKIILGAIALIIAGVGVFSACQKDSTLKNVLRDTRTSLAQLKERIVTIDRTATGGYGWMVMCINGSDTTTSAGFTRTKREAKAEAKKIVCSTAPGGGNNYIVSIMSEDPDNLQGSINALVVNGCMVYLDEINPWTNTFHRFTQNDISANALAWLSEICFYDETLSQAYELVTAQLKVWDVYLGGDSKGEIMVLHNLTAEQFDAIAAKLWKQITIEQTEIITITEDENENDIEITTIHLDWDFKY